MAGRRILIIDGEVGAARALKRTLETVGGHVVRLAHTGPEGVAIARTMRPELVFLDLVLPGMEGTEVAASFDEDEKLADTPIVFVTSVVGEDEEPLVTRRPLLTKPIAVEDLKACLAKYLAPPATA